MSTDGPFGSAGPLLLFGHRGYSAIAPENTLAAFQALLDHDVPGAELDVHLSADGIPVVIHDSSLQRVTGHAAAVEDSPVDAIRSLEAGSWFGAAFAGQRIPLLEEVFALLGRRVYYDIELKWRSRRTGALERAVLACIHRHGLRDRCLLSSFNFYCLREVRRLDRGIPTALIYSRHREVPPLLRHGEGRLFCRTDFLKPHHRQVHALSRIFFSGLLGSPLIPWTVEDAGEARRLVALGVRGLISNDPGKLRPALAGAEPPGR